MLLSKNILNYVFRISNSTCCLSTAAKSPLTLVTQVDGVRNIMLNNEKTRNALSLEMMNEIHSKIVENQDDPSLRVIVLSAKGHIFSAGHNLKELTPDNAGSHNFIFSRCTDLIKAILKSPVPVIAKIDGLAAAAGCQLVASCDMVICSQTSSFSTPGASFGIFCSTPGIAVVRAVPRMVASYMLFTGLPLKADEALQAGLVSKVVPSKQLDNEMEIITDAIKAKSRSVITLGKKFFNEQLTMGLEEAYEKGGQIMVDNLALNDGKEGIQSFIEKRKPKWCHKME